MASLFRDDSTICGMSQKPVLPGNDVFTEPVEPKVYAVIVGYKDESALHIGVHTSLDEAVAAASNEIGAPGDMVSIELWATLTGSEIIQAISSRFPAATTELPESLMTTEELLLKTRLLKNVLMKRLIDIDAVNTEHYNSVLNAADKRYIKSKIKTSCISKEPSSSLGA